jgi:hypothetical protein
MMMNIALQTRKLALSLVVLAAILLPALNSAPAHAQLYHTWVSRNGSDTNPCTAVAPCATFAGALFKTGPGNEVSCLDSGNFGQVTITLTVVIDCTGTVGTPNGDSSVTCSSAIVINVPGGVVSLRGLNVAAFGTIPCQTNGILIQAATAVYIEDCVIENFTQKGIFDNRTSGGTKLVIKNTIVRNIAGPGIVVAATPRNSAVLDNVQSVGNTFGIAVGNSNNVVINRSVMSENSNAGIEADVGSYVYVDNTMISQNGDFGVYAAGTVGLANSDITFNATGISGATMSYGNNRLFLNGPSTAPTPIGATSPDFGQQ